MKRPDRVLLVGCVLTLASPAAAVVSDPSVVSVRDDGGNASLDAGGPVVSADGRYVAFTSTEALTGLSTGGVRQLFVRDRLSGRTILASSGPTGVAADAEVDSSVTDRRHAISGDGRFVVFSSSATNLSPFDSDGGQRDVFRKELVSGAVALVSRAANGDPANGAVAGDPDVSHDGSRVAYETGGATNLWADTTGSSSDIVARDLVAGTTEVASVASGGGALTGVIQRPSISPDGRHVAFEDNGAITVRNLAAATTRVAAAGLFPDLSGNGRVVAYQTGSSVAAIAVGGSAETIAVTGTEPGISADGRRVAFTTSSALNEPGGPIGFADVYVRDRPGASSSRASERVTGVGGAAASGSGAISANGGVVAFQHDDSGSAPLLVDGDIDQVVDVIVSGFTPTDLEGPTVSVTSPAPGVVLPGRIATISGTVVDDAGVATLTVGGIRASLGPSGEFGVTLTVASGTSQVPIVAVDGAGNVRETTATVTSPGGQGGMAQPKARVRNARIFTSGRATYVRFRLDAGASRVTVRLWRRSRSSPPQWVPATVAKTIRTRAGRRVAVVRVKPIPTGVYQVRISVVSPGGVAVSTTRYVVARSRR